MTYAKRYVSTIVATGIFNEPAIVLALYGYRGGIRCTAEMTVQQAEALLSQLNEAIELMKAEREPT